MADEEDDHRFRSSRGRADHNPYVDRIHEYAPWAMTAEQADSQAGRWRDEIGVAAGAPLIVEIGPGNGFFFRELCRRCPEAALVAIEVRFKRVWMTARKARGEELERFRVVHHHAAHLAELFAPGEVSAVHANHPDPWPKERHHVKRLLQPAFRGALQQVLAPGGELWLKSDFAEYGPLSRDLFSEPGWTELAFTADLHGAGSTLPTEAPDGAAFWAADIETNYERKSRLKGLTIMAAGFRWGPTPAAAPASPGSADAS